MTTHARLGCLLLLPVAALLAGCDEDAPKPARLQPKRLYSIGDSITRAFDAYLPGDDLPLSWVNGSTGFWQQFLGAPNVNAHNQRITAIYGSSGRTNVIGAVNGARWHDALGQAQNGIGGAPTYVTIMLGGNDVCRDTILDLPTGEEIQAEVVATLDYLDQNLPAGASVVVVGIPDIKRLYDVAVSGQGAFGLIDCEAIWQTTTLGFPCGSMLSPDNTEADRLYAQSQNQLYNGLIQLEVNNHQKRSTRVHYKFLDASTTAFTADDISTIDCFHPSGQGEALLSSMTWSAGPFGGAPIP